MGGQITPDPEKLNKYWKLIQYRFGLYYATNNVMLRNTQLNEIGLTLGIGLPLRKVLSTVNFAVTVGQKGTTANELIQEQFVKVTLGFTFNDKWFTKRKFE